MKEEQAELTEANDYSKSLLAMVVEALWKALERVDILEVEPNDVRPVVKVAAEAVWSGADTLLGVEEGDGVAGRENLGPLAMQLRVVAWALWAAYELGDRTAGINSVHSFVHALDSVMEVLPGLLEEWERLTPSDAKQAA